jgi:hypothetical protein
MVGVAACIARVVAVFLRILTALSRSCRTSLRISREPAPACHPAALVAAPEAWRLSRTKSSEAPDRLLSDEEFIETLNPSLHAAARSVLEGAQELKREALALLGELDRLSEGSGDVVQSRFVLERLIQQCDDLPQKIRAADEAGRDDARPCSDPPLPGAGRKRLPEGQEGVGGSEGRAPVSGDLWQGARERPQVLNSWIVVRTEESFRNSLPGCLAGRPGARPFCPVGRGCAPGSLRPAARAREARRAPRKKRFW